MIVKNVSTSRDQIISSSSCWVLGGDGIKTGSAFTSNEAEGNVFSMFDDCDAARALERLIEGVEETGGEPACGCRRIEGLPWELFFEFARIRAGGE